MVADSVSITKSVDDDWANDLDQALAAHREEQTGQAQLSSSQVIEKTLVDPPNAWKVDEEEEFRLEPLVEPPPPMTLAPPVVEEPTVASSRTAKTLPKKPRWQSPAFVAALGVGGLIAAGSIFVLFALLMKSPRNNLDTLANKTTQQNPPIPVVDPATPPANQNLDSTPEPNATPTEVAQPNVAANPTTEEVTTETPAAALPNDATMPEQSDVVDNGKPVPPPIVEPATTPTPQVAQADADQEIVIPQIFQKFGGLNRKFESDVSDAAGTIEPSEVKKPPEEVIEFAASSHLTPAAKPDPKVGLELVVHRLKFEKRSLSEFAAVLSNLMGTGVFLDFESIATIGHSPASQLSIDATDLSIQDLAKQSLDPMGLGLRIHDESGLVYIAASDETMRERLPKVWTIEGLVDPANYEALGKSLSLLLPDESIHWKIEGSKIVWQPAARVLDQARLAVALDRIRVAVGKPPLSGYHVESLGVGLDVGKIEPKLQIKAERENPQRRPVIASLVRAAKDRNIDLVVDWMSLWRHGVTPSTEDIFLEKDRDFNQLSREIREKYVLELAVIDQKTLWLTVPETRRYASQIRLLPIQEGETVESITERLRFLSPINVQRRSRLIVVPLPGKPFVMVRVCPPTIEQLSKLGWL